MINQEEGDIKVVLIRWPGLIECTSNETDVVLLFFFRDRPAAIPVDVKSIDDTSNFDEFPDVDLHLRKSIFLFFLPIFSLYHWLTFFPVRRTYRAYA